MLPIRVGDPGVITIMAKSKNRKAKPKVHIHRRIVIRDTVKSLRAKLEATQSHLQNARENYENLYNSHNALLNGDNYRWKMRNGELIAPRDMTEEHLRNTVSFIERMLVHAFGSVPYLDATEERLVALTMMIRECRRRGFRV